MRCNDCCLQPTVGKSELCGGCYSGASALALLSVFPPAADAVSRGGSGLRKCSVEGGVGSCRRGQGNLGKWRRGRLVRVGRVGSCSAFAFAQVCLASCYKSGLLVQDLRACHCVMSSKFRIRLKGRTLTCNSALRIPARMHRRLLLAALERASSRKELRLTAGEAGRRGDCGRRLVLALASVLLPASRAFVASVCSPLFSCLCQFTSCMRLNTITN